MAMIEQADLDKRFDYHAPDEERAHLHEVVRGLVKDTAERLNTLVPDSREKALVMTHLEEVMFWANAAIARVG
jgi:hypothetical protein